MKTASAELATFLDVTTAGIMRHLIVVTPRTGSAALWTDHTANIAYEWILVPSITLTFLAGGGGTTNPVIVLGGYEATAGLDVTTMDMRLFTGGVALFNGVPIAQAALDGWLDGATVQIWRVFGAKEIDVSLGKLWIFSGYVGTVTVTDYGVEMELESGLADLRRTLPKIAYQPGCTATVYDAQCALVKATHTVTGTVSAGATTTVIPSNRTEATGTTNSLGFFALGVLTFTSGVLNGIARGVRSYSNTGGTFTVDQPLPSAPANGDTFSVYPGCPKTTTACANNTAANGPAFNNLTHFRGFPYVPSEGSA